VNEQPARVFNVFIDRFGFLGEVNYGYSEWFQMRPTRSPKWSLVAPDVGMIFFGDIGRYREFYVGGGFEFRPTEALTIDHEADFDQATGADGHGKIWYQPWTRFAYQFPQQFVSEVVVIPYVPLNGGATQFVLERSKVEYTGFRHFNVGAGYAAYQDFSFTPWQNKPFAALTWKSPNLGQFEVWFQALPNSGFQFQSRHVFTWKSRHWRESELVARISLLSRQRWF